MKKYLAALLFCCFVAGNVNATIFVPSFGSSGPQSYSYTFDDYFYGMFTIGVANEGDNGQDSYLDLNNFGGLLSWSSDKALVTSGLGDMSGYLNTKGEPGTNGEVLNFEIDAYEGDTISFDWIFSTSDYEPFNDFAFVNLSGLYMIPTDLIAGANAVGECCDEYTGGFYEVIAEISGEADVVEPSVLALLGLGLAGIGFASRKKIN